MTFRAAALLHWQNLYGDAEWGPCEECSVWIHRDTAPHHRRGYEGGLGGKRKHDPEGLVHLCQSCHDQYEREGR